MCGLLLAGYQGLVSTGTLHSSPGLHPWEENRVRAEMFADSPAHPGAVILCGSSQIARVPAADVDGQAVNLGMVGGSPQTGVEMIRRHAAPSCVVVVELGAPVQRALDTLFVTGVFDQAPALRRQFSALRCENRPASVALSALRGWLLRHKSPSATPSAPTLLPSAAADDTPLDEVTRESLRRGALLLRQQLADLRRDHQARIFLVRLPQSAAKDESLAERQTRELLAELFPADEWQWLAHPVRAIWQTTDGVHLTPQEAAAFAHHLRAELTRLGVVLNAAPPLHN